MLPTLGDLLLQFLGGDGERSRAVRLNDIEALVCEAIKADQDRGEADLDRLGDVIDGLAQVLGSCIGHTSVSVVDQSGMDGRQILVYERDGSYA